MKPHLQKIQLSPGHSFDAQHLVVPHFYNKWHYHQELELAYMIKGSGRQFIGNTVHHFKAGDMVLIGSNLPHLFRSDEKYLTRKTRQKCESYVIHFHPECLGEQFFQLPENKHIRHLLEKAEQGIRIKNEDKLLVVELMEQLLAAKTSKRIILLMEILHTIAYSKSIRTICSKDFDFQNSLHDGERLNNIYQYIMNNFHRDIPLKKIAEVAHLSPNAFCRYFKSRLKKPFSGFLIEVRIGHACKLLAETDDPVADICYACGYNNFSNFNRHFKFITEKTPLAHRKYYQELRNAVA